MPEAAEKLTFVEIHLPPEVKQRLNRYDQEYRLVKTKAYGKVVWKTEVNLRRLDQLVKHLEFAKAAEGVNSRLFEPLEQARLACLVARRRLQLFGSVSGYCFVENSAGWFVVQGSREVALRLAREELGGGSVRGAMADEVAEYEVLRGTLQAEF